jgi:fatty-acyl-CoA synthase
MFARISRLAGGLSSLGVIEGDTVGVLDYDSHRYLESYFAIPMMGAVLFTVNWRLSPDQIEYTMNHSGTSVIIVHSDFLGLIEPIRDRLKTVQKIVVIDETGSLPDTKLHIDAEYEDMLRHAAPEYDFPDLYEELKATTSTHPAPRAPQGRVLLAPPSGAPHHEHPRDPGVLRVFHEALLHRCLHAHHHHVHVHAWGFPYLATMMGVSRCTPGSTSRDAAEALLGEKVPIPLRAHHPPDVVSCPVTAKVDLTLGGHHRRGETSQGPGQRRPWTWASA